MSVERLDSRRTRVRAALAVVGCSLAFTAFAAPPDVKRVGNAVVMTVPPAAPNAPDPVDYVNARPLEMPVAEYSGDDARRDLVEALLEGEAATRQGAPGWTAGNAGSGKLSPMHLGKPAGAADDDAVPADHGTSRLPFSSARADGYTGSTNTIYPFRAAGRLFFTKDGNTGTCSASLIKRGIVVTAAHCVSEFGRNRFYANFRFVPGYRNGAAPYGTWVALRVWAPAAYVNGSSPCSQAGVVCRDDVAVIEVAAQRGQYPGSATGWYGYAYNGAGFAGNVTHITQLGYPSCLDNGALMERNDAQGAVSRSQVNNTVIGSLMCPGSSGGPWLVNFGKRPNLTGTNLGGYGAENVVIGTTSWVSNNNAKQMGASPFLNTNVHGLVQSACNAAPAGACAN